MAQEDREAYIAWLRDEIEKHCNSEGRYEAYWDYNDSITPDQLFNAMEHFERDGYASPLAYLEVSLVEDYYFTTPMEEALLTAISQDAKSAPDGLGKHWDESDDIWGDLEAAGYQGIDANLDDLLSRSSFNVNVFFATEAERNFDMSSIVNAFGIDIEVDETGSTLHDLQRLVGGNIEPFDVIFGEGISLYVNEEGLFTCPPNRAVYATKGMEEAGYLSMMDYSSPVKEGELYSILCGDLVAVGFDFETGENRDLSADEMSRVADYFTEVSKPGSGIEEVIAIRMGQRREEARSEDGRVTLKGEAQASRAASEKLAEGRDTGSPAREDPSIV